MRITMTTTVVMLLSVVHLLADGGADILYIGRFDLDDHPDTVLGRPTADLRMLATAIHWGAPYSSSGDHEELRRTTLRYPTWRGLAGSFAVVDVNADAIDDLVLFFNAERPASRDSTRAIALLGSDALHGVAEIALDEVGRTNPRMPFVAIDIESAALLGDRRVRENSGAPSYRWGSIALRASDSIGPASAPPTLSEWMALYPNPASVAATLEARRLGPGDYTVDLIDIDGTIHLERRIVLQQEQSLTSTIDVSDHPPGLYLVRVRRAGELVASYPVVVVR